MFRNIIKNYIYNLIYQLFILLVPIVTAPYLARILEPECNGIYSFIFSITSIIHSLTTVGIFNYGVRSIAYVRDDKQKLNDIFWQIMSTRLVLGILGTFIYFITVIYIGKFRIYFFHYYFFLLACYLDCTWIYVGVEDMKWAVIKNALTKFLTVIGIFLFVKSKSDFTLYIIIMSTSLLASNLLAYTQLHNYVGKPRITFTNFYMHIRRSIELFLPSLAVAFYTQCDKVMLGIIGNGPEQISFYDYAEKIIFIPLSFITVLSTVMMPRIANEYSKGNMRNIAILLNKALNFSMFIAFPMTFGIIIIADKFVPWYLGDVYMPTIECIIIMAPVLIANTFIGISGGQYFTALNRINILISSTFLASFINFILNFILIPIYGFLGAAIATVCSTYVCASYQFVYLMKELNINNFFQKLIKYLCISIFMMLVTKQFTIGYEAKAITNFVQVCIASIIYFIGCILTKDEILSFIINRIIRIIKN